jgi:hypothetical protein
MKHLLKSLDCIAENIDMAATLDLVYHLTVIHDVCMLTVTNTLMVCVVQVIYDTHVTESGNGTVESRVLLDKLIVP